jgi:flavin-dependent dehydrogenase
LRSRGFLLSGAAASRNDNADVVVIGGGPAGAAAARLLAQCGRRVVVLAGPLARRPGSAESLPPSCRKPLLMLDAVDDVANAGFLRSTGNTTAWGAAASRVEPFAHGEAGLQVPRREFDALLLRLAAEAGATVIHAAATAVSLPAERGETGHVEWCGARDSGRMTTP